MAPSPGLPGPPPDGRAVAAVVVKMTTGDKFTVHCSSAEAADALKAEVADAVRGRTVITLDTIAGPVDVAGQAVAHITSHPL